MSDTARATPGNSLTVGGTPVPRIQEEPNLSACPGRIDGHRKDAFKPDPDFSEFLNVSTKVNPYE